MPSPEPSSSPRSSRCPSPMQKIVVTEQDFHRCNGDLEQLRLCHKPYAPLRRDDSFKTAFEKRCREPVEQLRDPWKDVGDPEQLRDIGAIDTIFSQVLPQALPQVRSPSPSPRVDDSPGADRPEVQRVRSRSSSEHRSSSRGSRKSREASREGRVDSHAARKGSQTTPRASRQRSRRVPTVSGLPPIMSSRTSKKLSTKPTTDETGSENPSRLYQLLVLNGLPS